MVKYNAVKLFLCIVSVTFCVTSFVGTSNPSVHKEGPFTYGTMWKWSEFLSSCVYIRVMEEMLNVRWKDISKHIKSTWSIEAYSNLNETLKLWDFPLSPPWTWVECLFIVQTLSAGVLQCAVYCLFKFKHKHIPAGGSLLLEHTVFNANTARCQCIYGFFKLNKPLPISPRLLNHANKYFTY